MLSGIFSFRITHPSRTKIRCRRVPRSSRFSMSGKGFLRNLERAKQPVHIQEEQTHSRGRLSTPTIQHRDCWGPRLCHTKHWSGQHSGNPSTAAEQIPPSSARRNDRVGKNIGSGAKDFSRPLRGLSGGTRVPAVKKRRAIFGRPLSRDWKACDLITIYRSFFTEGIDTEAAPAGPHSSRFSMSGRERHWSGEETRPRDRIVVYVVNLLVLLLLGEDVEVIKPRLPEASAVPLTLAIQHQDFSIPNCANAAQSGSPGVRDPGNAYASAKWLKPTAPARETSAQRKKFSLRRINIRPQPMLTRQYRPFHRKRGGWSALVFQLPKVTAFRPAPH